MWYLNYVVKEFSVLCKVELNIGVVLNHVMDVAVAAPSGNDPDDLEN